MRKDVKKALRGRSLSFFGAHREIKRLDNYLHEEEEVHDLVACSFGDTGGRALVVVTDERVLVYKDGWIFRNSQAMAYSDIRTIEIRSGLLWAKIKFKGEGMSFEISKAGRFSAEHAVKIIRSRIGSRYNNWEIQRQLLLDQKNQAQQPSQTPTANLTAPAPFYQTEEPLTLDQFLSPAPTANQTETNTGTTPAVTGSMVDELERLQSLLRIGILTPEEFTIAKKKLLGQ